MSTPATRTADDAIASVSEFPERLGPVLIKELRQGLRTGLFVIPFLVLPAILALVAVWALAVESRTSARGAISTFFWIAVIVPVVIITPLRALGSIRSEREAQTLDLLQLTPLTAWRIVFAKWSSLVVQSSLWVVALLPFFVLRYFFGNVNLTEEIFQLVLFVLCGAALTAISMVVSTLPRLMFWLCIAALAFLFIWMLGVSVVSFYSTSLFREIFGGSSGSSWQTFLMIDGAIVHATALTLALAASRIAPLADNYALRLRLGVLSFFVWWALASLFLPFGTDRDLPWVFFAIAVVALILFAGYELVSERTPLAVHLKPWRRFGVVGRIVARLFVPGWPSAAAFASVLALFAVVSVLIHVGSPFSGGNGNKVTHVIALGLFAWCAVILPRGIQCMFRLGGVERPILHLLLHLAGGVLAIVLGVFTFVLGDASAFPGVIYPSSIFWLVLTGTARTRDAAAFLLAFGLLWNIALACVLIASSRNYWRTLAAHAKPAAAK